MKLGLVILVAGVLLLVGAFFLLHSIDPQAAVALGASVLFCAGTLAVVVGALMAAGD